MSIKQFLITVRLISFLLTFSVFDIRSMYFCTAASSFFFPHLLNLIGSIHKVNFNELKEIAVFDLGLTTEQKQKLKNIEKLNVYTIENTHPQILQYFILPTGKRVLGWFAWKPVVIKQALELFPQVIWLDSATTVLRPLNDLFSYIEHNKYFICTSGDEKVNSKFLHPVGWGATKYVQIKFNINSQENCWILDQETVMGGIIGVTRTGSHYFLDQLYQLSFDLRNFQDDGTTPSGWGTGRHDQTLLSIIAYTKKLEILKQDYTQQEPFILCFKDQTVPCYITWNKEFVSDKTVLYSSRGDLSKIDFFTSFIRYKR